MWSDTLKASGASTPLGFVVGDEEEIQTPAGSFQALPVRIQVGEIVGGGGAGGEIVRWYAEGVGLVREETYLAGEGGATLIEDKRLLERFP